MPNNHLTMESQEKLNDIICCPECYNRLVKDDILTCQFCRKQYPIYNGIPVPILDTELQNKIADDLKGQMHLKEIIKSKIPMPDERLWMPRAKNIIKKILNENNPDGENNYVVNLGSGVESFFKRVFKPLKSLIRIGIPHDGKVNAYGDAMALPLKNDSVDLFFSSSVIEHLPDPEKAVSELFRTIKPGGLVYAEIPFIGAYHMAPYDYQRYTISGIESLFNRHGFKLVEKGICTGPITALVLLFQHAIVEAIPIGPIQYLFRVTLTWILHPLKYLDFLFGQTKWGEYLACNFFYLGRKPG